MCGLRLNLLLFLFVKGTGYTHLIYTLILLSLSFLKMALSSLNLIRTDFQKQVNPDYELSSQDLHSLQTHVLVCRSEMFRG